MSWYNKGTEKNPTAQIFWKVAIYLSVYIALKCACEHLGCCREWESEIPRNVTFLHFRVRSTLIDFDFLRKILSYWRIFWMWALFAILITWHRELLTPVHTLYLAGFKYENFANSRFCKMAEKKASGNDLKMHDVEMRLHFFTSVSLWHISIK